MNSEMLVALLVNVAAFTVLYVGLLMGRTYIARLEAAKAADTAMAGDAVSPPRLTEIEDV
jgi:uncharacterized membrane protein